MSYNVISLGAGVQSSTVALMAARELIKPMPDFAVFADTQAEPPSVYEYLEYLKEALPFPVHVVSAGNLATDSMVVKTSASGKKRLDLGVPMFTPFKGRTIMLGRECTKHYKVMAVRREIRERIRPQRDTLVTQWIGVSLDEAHRMKESPVKWLQNRFPLIEALMSRGDCLEWLKSQGFPEPPKSACVFCPYNSNARWQNMKVNDPASFEQAVKWERDVNDKREETDFLKSPVYIHPSLKPLDQIEFIDERQLSLFVGNSFGNECEGMCGV